MVKRVFGYVEIPAEDPQTATQFYKQAFGWDNEVEAGPDYAYMYAGNLTVGFPKIDDESRQAGEVIVYVDSSDLEADIAQNSELGGTTLIGKTPIDEKSWFAWLKDTTGNALGIFEQSPDSETDDAKQKQAGRALVHVEIPVKNRHTDAQYYANLFGWEIQHMDEMNYSFFMTPDETFGGGFPELDEQYKPGDIIVYLHSDDLEADSQTIEAAGGKLLGPVIDIAGYGAMRFWSDPTGNRLALWKSNHSAK